MKITKAIEILSMELEVTSRTGRADSHDAIQLGIEALKDEKQYKEYLILVYPKGGGQPKEVWWLQNENECKEQQAKLAEAQEEFVSFKARVLVMFH